MRRPKNPEPGQTTADHVQLSEREKKIILMLCLGRSHKQIASALHCEESTIRTRVHRLSSDLRVDPPGKMGLVMWALQRPTVMNGSGVSLNQHKPGCDCTMPYCVAMREARNG